MKGIFKQNVSASSLLEVVVAMVIIVVVMVIALNIFARVTQSTLPMKKVRAMALLSHYETEIEQSKDLASQTFYQGDWRIEKTVKPYPLASSLLELDLTVYDNHQEVIASIKKVISNAGIE